MHRLCAHFLPPWLTVLVLIIMLLATPVPVIAYPSSSAAASSSSSSPMTRSSRASAAASSSSHHKMSPLNGDQPTSTTSGRTIMVTGANGYLASYIVKDLLAMGHTVHACVRDASNEESVQHLKDLPSSCTGLKLFSTGDLAKAGPGSQAFDVPMKGCDAVFHAATPLNIKFGADHNGHDDIYQPAMISTQELLDCIGRHADTVRCLVLTSSMAAVAPRPEPPIKDESHWSDADSQKERQNWYGCTKTSQEQLVRNWVNDNIDNNKLLHPNFVYAAICPTMVIGPQLRRPTTKVNGVTKVEGTMGSLQKWLRGGRSQAPNDSMSFIHVEDCAKMHTHILNLEATQINQHQRYMSLIESLHWNDILKLLQELHPGLPTYTPYQGDDTVTPTQFNLDNMHSLLTTTRSSMRTTREALLDSIDYLNQIGALGTGP